jgi:threonine dehydrogenase-like Zn-dependent dehydrogenase
MRALVWHGKYSVSVDNVPDPRIQEPTDAIVKITSTAICGSDLHLFDGYMPTMEDGDILGHEPMGIVEEVGSAVKNLKKGDRVVVPFVIACGSCFFCEKTLYSCCDTTNPNAEMAEKMMGHSPAGLFGFSHMLGGFPGGQAEYLRVPHADVGPIKIESDLPDEKVLFLSDIFPTGYMAAENADIEPGDTGCRVGLRPGRARCQSRARGCLAPAASSASTAYRSASRWPVAPAAPRQSISMSRTSTRHCSR